MDKKTLKKILQKIFLKVYFFQSKVGDFLKNKIITYNVSNKYFEDEYDFINMKELNVYVADVFENRNGIVTIVSDDGFYPSGKLLNELLKKYKLKATVAGAVCFVKPYLKEWKKIIEEGYIEMVSHSYKHRAFWEGSEISQEEDRLYYEIVRSTKWINQKFSPNGKQIVFVCPEGAICKLANKILFENGFYAVRRTKNGYNSLNPKDDTKPGDWFCLNVQGIAEKDIKEDVRRGWIEKTSEEKLWLIEMWHNVMIEDDGYCQTILKDDAEKHIAFISEMENEKKIWVATLTQATKYLREKQAVNIEAYWCKDYIYLRLKLNNITMYKKGFDFPLTVNIELPMELERAVFYLDDRELVAKNNNLTLNVVPNGNVISINIKF